MEFKKLTDFAHEESEALQKKFGYSGMDFTFATTIKLGEELGELNEQILKHFNFQRHDKDIKDKLEHEIADVVIVAGILADSLDIDLKKALEEKMEITRNRRKGQ